MLGENIDPAAQHSIHSGVGMSNYSTAHHGTGPLSPFRERSNNLRFVSPHHAAAMAMNAGTADRCIRFWNCLTGHGINCIDTGSQVCVVYWTNNCALHRYLVQREVRKNSHIISVSKKYNKHSFTTNSIYCTNYYDPSPSMTVAANNRRGGVS